MFSGTPTAPLNLAAVETDASERTAERSWELADADEGRKPDALDVELAKVRQEPRDFECNGTCLENHRRKIPLSS